MHVSTGAQVLKHCARNATHLLQENQVFLSNEPSSQKIPQPCFETGFLIGLELVMEGTKTD